MNFTVKKDSWLVQVKTFFTVKKVYGK